MVYLKKRLQHTYTAGNLLYLPSLIYQVRDVWSPSFWCPRSLLRATTIAAENNESFRQNKQFKRLHIRRCWLDVSNSVVVLFLSHYCMHFFISCKTDGHKQWGWRTVPQSTHFNVKLLFYLGYQNQTKWFIDWIETGFEKVIYM